MAAQITAGTFANILKDFYLGPIQEQLNQETLVTELFEKASVDWNGRQVIIPVHTGRNPATGYRAEGVALPPAGLGVGALGGAGTVEQDYQRLVVQAHFLYGRFQITGPAMAAAGKGGANSFVGWVDSEMNRLVTDIKVAANRAATSGGRVIGFVTHQSALGAGVNEVLEFDGDAVKAEALRNGGPENVDLVRMDTYAIHGSAEVEGAAPAAAGTIELDSVAGIAAFPTDAAGGLIPMAVVANAAGAVILGSAAEPVGIYGNLGDPTHFTVDRTTATGVAALQCGDGAAAPTSNAHSTMVADNTRLPLTLAHLQTALDRQTLASDTEPDCILMNPLQRTRLAGLFQAVIQMDANRSVSKADGGFSGFSYAGIEVKTSRHVDNGLILLLDTSTWKMTELESGKFADEDGNVLSRVGVLDAWEGFYKWYYNVVCLRPNANSIITGLTL